MAGEGEAAAQAEEAAEVGDGAVGGGGTGGGRGQGRWRVFVFGTDNRSCTKEENSGDMGNFGTKKLFRGNEGFLA